MLRPLFTLLLLVCLKCLAANDSLRVYVIVAEECPISIAMAAPLREVLSRYPQLRYTAVFPNLKSDAMTARIFLGRYELESFHPELDPQQVLTRRLGATVTPEVVVTDAGDRVLYRGRISDAYSAPGRVRHGKTRNELLSALDRLSAGQPVPTPWPAAVGCFITFLPAESQPE